MASISFRVRALPRRNVAVCQPRQRALKSLHPFLTGEFNLMPQLIQHPFRLQLFGLKVIHLLGEPRLRLPLNTSPSPGFSQNIPKRFMLELIEGLGVPVQNAKNPIDLVRRSGSLPWLLDCWGTSLTAKN